MTTAILTLQHKIEGVYYNMSEEDKTKLWITTITWAIGIYVAATLSVMGYCVTQLNTLNYKITQMDSSRFDIKDADKLRDSINSLSLRIASLPSESPPRWLLEKIDKVEAKVEKLESNRSGR